MPLSISEVYLDMKGLYKKKTQKEDKKEMYDYFNIDRSRMLQ